MNNRLQRLLYEWPPNLNDYEARLFLGLSATEGIAGGMVFMLVTGLVPNRLLGLILGIVLFVGVVLSLKKMESLGNISIPLYLWRRWQARRNPRTLQLTQIVGVQGATVHIEDEHGRLITLE